MSNNTIRGGLIQATLCESAMAPIEKIKRAMIDKHVALIEQAAGEGVQVLCLRNCSMAPTSRPSRT